MGEYSSNREGTRGFCRKAGGLFLLFAAVLFALLFCRIPANAAEGDEPTRSFAIVFDNSGSMYTSTTWCDTIYSMEAFAAMANDGDEIGIYPMNPIEVNGTTYTRESPLVVQGGGDTSAIRDIYTPSSLDTHIETISDAYSGLLGMTGEEKWLIVLTDGDVFYEDGVALDSEYGTDFSVSQERVSTLLSECSDSVNVVYLAIGSGATIPTVDGTMYSEVITASDQADILWDVIGISNIIYNRDTLTGVSDTLVFDQDQENVVLYVQGDDIANLRLVDADGNEAGILESASSLLCPEAPGSGSVALSPTYYAGNAADPTLNGAVVTYDSVPEGTYSILYDGISTAVGAYYETDAAAELTPVPEDETEREELAEAEEETLEIEEAEDAEEIARAATSRHRHRARFWVLIILLIIVIAAAVAAFFILNQRVLPNVLRAKVSRFTLNGREDRDVKKPYLRYSGGGKGYGRIVIGPRSGTTDFDYRLALKLEATGKRMKKSGERGAVIVSLPTEIGNLTSYTIDTGHEQYTYTKGEAANPKKTLSLGQRFTYTMYAQSQDSALTDGEETVVMVVELAFR